MHFHPPNMPVVKYYRLNGINFTYCWRAGCTSITQLAQDNDAKVLPEAPEICMLLLKNPIERFASSYMILAIEKILNNTTGLFEHGLPPISKYLDGMLDDVEGVRSPHTWGQIVQHKDVKHLQLFRLEGTTHIADVKLPHLNKTMVPKPVISDLPRYPELFDFYAKDIEAWERAKPLIGV